MHFIVVIGGHTLRFGTNLFLLYAFTITIISRCAGVHGTNEFLLLNIIEYWVFLHES